MSTLLLFSSKGSFTISEALFFFLLVAIMTVGLCSTAALRRKRENAERAEEIKLGERRFDNEEKGGKVVLCWGGMSEVMARVVCWRGRRGRAEMMEGGVEWKDVEAGKGMGSRNSVGVSPLWQKRILMGERCQMPMFSGVIHYDERGRLLRGNSSIAKQERPAAPVTTLKDLL